MPNYAETLNKLIEIVVSEGASDLHLTAGSNPTLRVSGVLTPLLSENKITNEDILGMLSVMLPPDRKDKFMADQEIDFSYEYVSKQSTARFRGNAYFQRGTAGVALRFVPYVIRSVSELNLPLSIEQFSERKQGFFLVVGPVGQGKTTTLAALIEKINMERPAHVITIEDPIEYIFQNKRALIEQREVRVDTKSFATALESIFREDADVLMIGEMRDPLTMATAVTAAETGHLVFSTLHTNNAAQTIDRIIDSFPATQQEQIRIQLAGSLAGIFSQRLLPRVSGGLIPAYELLFNNNAVANLIREKRTHEIETVIETGAEEGMIDMNRCLADLVRQGQITIESAYARSWSPKTLERLL